MTQESTKHYNMEKARGSKSDHEQASDAEETGITNHLRIPGASARARVHRDQIMPYKADRVKQQPDVKLPLLGKVGTIPLRREAQGRGRAAFSATTAPTRF